MMTLEERIERLERLLGLEPPHPLTVAQKRGRMKEHEEMARQCNMTGKQILHLLRNGEYQNEGENK